jgi:hypothetical protein
MKRLLITASLLALAASPAMAQSFNPNIGTGNIVPGPDTPIVWAAPGPGPFAADDAFAMAGAPGVKSMPVYIGNELVWPVPAPAFAGAYPYGSYRPY